MGVDREEFLKLMPFYSVWYKVLFLFVFQFLIFVFAMVFFWWISKSMIIYGSLIGQFAVSFLGVLPFIYVAAKHDKIRIKYKEKFGNLAAQKFWLNYQSYSVSLQAASLYFPLILKTDYFLPAFIVFPPHILTNSLFPVYIAIPAGIVILAVGFIISKSFGEFGTDVNDHRFHLIYPDKAELITTGIYGYIRNPMYLCRGLISMGLGVIANNFLAILVGFIHFIAISSLIIPENHELAKRFGQNFYNYKKKTGSFIPKYGSWMDFIRFVFHKKEK